MDKKLNDETLYAKFKELNVAVTQIISSLCDDSDQSIKNDERIDDMMSIFNLINDDLDRIKGDINNLIDQSTKHELASEDKALEIEFNAGLSIRDSSDLPYNTSEEIQAPKQHQQVSFNKKDAKIILEHTKKENESLIKEIESQEKNLKLVKENVNKILNK